MTVTTTLPSTVYVHQQNGECWGTQAGGWPARLGAGPANLRKQFPDVQAVRLLSRPENAAVIVRLIAMREQGLLQSVQLVSPLCCPTALQRERPVEALYFMQQFYSPPSLGGFREATLLDALACRLQQETAASSVENAETVRQLVAAHPLWHPLSFIGELPHFAVAYIIGCILDPRNFIDPRRPDSLARLESYMGLHPRTMDAVLFGTRAVRHQQRCHHMLHVWYPDDTTQEQLLSIRDTLGEALQPVPRADTVGLRPQDFLLRTWVNRLRARPDEPPERARVHAALRASQHFLRFLRHLWLAEIYRNASAVPGGGEQLFSPVLFFRHAVEADAFQSYIVQRRDNSV